MDIDAFVRWALDDARTVDDRYTVELLVEQGVMVWNNRRKIYNFESMDRRMERSRERKLNPAYQPHYTEEDLRKAAEYLAEARDWHFSTDRPLRSLGALQFMTALEGVSLHMCEVADLTPLVELPALRKFSIGAPGYDFGNPLCEDFTPLTRCASLRELVLGFNIHWPDLTGFETMTQLEVLTLSGNLLAMPPGASFPQVKRAGLRCQPLAARSVADLPQLPACEFLTLSGIERLDGIEKMPGLRNLTLIGPFRSFAPLAPLTELTCLTVNTADHRDPEKQPRDISPLARLPKLVFFQIGPEHVILDMPRDYSPLAEAVALRELIVRRCPPVEMEVAAIQAGLQPWDDLFLAPEPRPLPPLRMIMAPHVQHPRHGVEHHAPGETGLIDTGLRACEGRWVGAFVHRFISEKIGHGDWGTAAADGLRHSLNLQIESFTVVERLPEILEAARQAMARLRADYEAMFMIALRVRAPELSPAQQQLEDQFRDQRDEWDRLQQERDHAEYLEKLHLLDLKKQQGEEIAPEEFSPSQRQDQPEPPDDDEEEDDEEEEGSGDDDVAVKKKPDPKIELFEDEHPLADNYRLMGSLTLEEAWFLPHHRGLAVHLMQREPDLEIPEEKEQP